MARFTIGRIMVVIAAVGVVLGAIAWALKPVPVPDGDIYIHGPHSAYITIGPFQFDHTSYGFWVILLLAFSLVVGLLVALAIGFVSIMKAFRRRFARLSP